MLLKERIFLWFPKRKRFILACLVDVIVILIVSAAHAGRPELNKGFLYSLGSPPSVPYFSLTSSSLRFPNSLFPTPSRLPLCHFFASVFSLNAWRTAFMWQVSTFVAQSKLWHSPVHAGVPAALLYLWTWFPFSSSHMSQVGEMWGLMSYPGIHNEDWRGWGSNHKHPDCRMIPLSFPFFAYLCSNFSLSLLCSCTDIRPCCWGGQ